MYQAYSYLKRYTKILFSETVCRDDFLKVVADIINTPASVHLLLVKKQTTVLALAKQDEQMNLTEYAYIHIYSAS
jgi:hypothetical protein